MNNEWITACTEDGTAIKTVTREEIHQQGYWHETFHCWIVELQKETAFIHLQLRSGNKKDFPDLLDISAAGHILAHETVSDGIREIEEELGIRLKLDELIPLGVIKDRLTRQDFTDNERCHVFLHKTYKKLDKAYKFQKEEVSGMFLFDLQEFFDLCAGAVEQIESKAAISAGGDCSARKVSLKDLVPHSKSYFEQVTQAIQQQVANWPDN